MKLAYVLLSPTFGMHQYTADLANRMAEVHNVSLVTTTSYSKDRYSPAVSASTPVSIANTGFSLEGLRIGRVRGILNALEEIRPDVVHITGPHLWNTVVVKWLRRHRIPVIHSIHDLDPHKGSRYGRLQELWNKLVIKSVNGVLVHGEVYRRRLIRRGLNSDTVLSVPLLHLFVSYNAQQTAQQQAQKPEYDGRLLFFGRLEEYKGVDILLEAYSALRMRSGPGNHVPDLILAGKGSIQEEWSEKLPAGIDVREHLIDDHEALELFGTCGVVILPYIDGTQSAVISSAYFFHKPVIVTRVGALPEYVVEGETGFVVEPGDPEALADAISSIIKDESALKRMGMAGRGWYDHQRDIELDSLISMYSKFSAS